MPTEVEETKPPADAETAAAAPADAAAAPAAPDVSSAVAAAVAAPADEPADEGSRKRAREEGSEGASHYDHGAAAAAPTTFAWEAKLAELIASGKIVKDELDDGAILQLKQVSEVVAMSCLDHFAETDLSTVRSKSAYLVGIIRRLNTSNPHTGVHPAANAVANHGSVDTASLDSTMAALPASVQGRLQQIFASGSVKPDDLEPRVVLELMEFGENGACTILDRYGSKNLSAVRNKTAFLIGVVRRYREEIKNGGPASMGGGGGGMGGGGHYGGGGGGGGYGGGAAAPPANPAMVQAAQQQMMAHPCYTLLGMGLLTQEQVTQIQNMVAQNLSRGQAGGGYGAEQYGQQQAYAQQAYAQQYGQHYGQQGGDSSGFGYSH